MNRFAVLLKELKQTYPEDSYIDGLSLSLRHSTQARAQVRAYSSATSRIDSNSWDILRAKAVKAFKQQFLDRGKSAFFDQLNEAFAYTHLTRKGCTNVAFLPESKQKRKAKTPDLSYMKQGVLHSCEVKTIHISAEMIERYKLENVYDMSVHQKLSEPFLGKLKATVETAFCQVNARGTQGMAYIVVHFDDIALHHYTIYRTQICQHLREQFPNQEVFLRVGVQGRRHIHHAPNGE